MSKLLSSIKIRINMARKRLDETAAHVVPLADLAAVQAWLEARGYQSTPGAGMPGTTALAITWDASTPPGFEVIS